MHVWLSPWLTIEIHNCLQAHTIDFYQRLFTFTFSSLSFYNILLIPRQGGCLNLNATWNPTTSPLSLLTQPLPPLPPPKLNVTLTACHYWLLSLPQYHYHCVHITTTTATTHTNVTIIIFNTVSFIITTTTTTYTTTISYTTITTTTHQHPYLRHHQHQHRHQLTLPQHTVGTQSVHHTGIPNNIIHFHCGRTSQIPSMHTKRTYTIFTNFTYTTLLSNGNNMKLIMWCYFLELLLTYSNYVFWVSMFSTVA